MAFLNSAATSSTSANQWNDTAPTSSVFSIGGGTLNTSGGASVFYAFAKTPGLIGIGSYTGNLNADGPYVVVDDGGVGFRPAFLLIKRDDGSWSWAMFDNKRDPYNDGYRYLVPDTTAAENTASTVNEIDFIANGFKVRDGGNNSINGSGATHFYIAFAAYPFGGESAAQARAR